MKTYEEMIARLAEMYEFADRFHSQPDFERADGFCFAIAVMFDIEKESVRQDAWVMLA